MRGREEDLGDDVLGGRQRDLIELDRKGYPLVPVDERDRFREGSGVYIPAGLYRTVLRTQEPGRVGVDPVMPRFYFEGMED